MNIKSMTKAILLTAGLGLTAAGAHAQQKVTWLTQTQQQNAQYPIEMKAIEAVTGHGVTVTRNEFQVLGLNLADALRLASSGTFQIVTTQIGSVAKDDPFLEGIDLIGVSTNMTELKTAVNAYRTAFNKRLEDRFGVKALAIWPFGPQVFFCNQPMTSLDSLKGLKVRSFTASMSTLLTDLGATPVTLSFPEVYPALERGVASCGVTSPTSANTGKWPEVTKFLMPLSVSGSVQAHIVNLAWWNALPADKKTELEGDFKALEDGLWGLATKANDDALACSTGGNCVGGIYTAYKMALVPVSDADNAKVKKISQDKILGEWAGRCEKNFPGCAKVWNDSIGAALKLNIAAK